MSVPPTGSHPPTQPTTYPTAPPTSPHSAGACPKCRNAMEFGLLIDGGKNNPIANRGYERAAQWVRGRPDKRFWDQAFDVNDENRLEVTTARCTACGFLELYARRPAP